MWICGTGGPSRVGETARPHRPDEVRHKETICTRTHRNGEEQIGEAVEKTGASRSRAKRTEVPAPISGPRYRGSNPCLPANTVTPSSSTTSSESDNSKISVWDCHTACSCGNFARGILVRNTVGILANDATKLLLTIRRSDEDARQIWKWVTDTPFKLSAAYIASISQRRLSSTDGPR
jgi:hypothetical protein